MILELRESCPLLRVKYLNTILVMILRFFKLGLLPDGLISMFTSVTISLIESMIFLNTIPSESFASNIFNSDCDLIDYNIKLR